MIWGTDNRPIRTKRVPLITHQSCCLMVQKAPPLVLAFRHSSRGIFFFLRWCLRWNTQRISDEGCFDIFLFCTTIVCYTDFNQTHLADVFIQCDLQTAHLMVKGLAQDPNSCSLAMLRFWAHDLVISSPEPSPLWEQVPGLYSEPWQLSTLMPNHRVGSAYFLLQVWSWCRMSCYGQRRRWDGLFHIPNKDLHRAGALELEHRVLENIEKCLMWDCIPKNLIREWLFICRYSCTMTYHATRNHCSSSLDCWHHRKNPANGRS